MRCCGRHFIRQCAVEISNALCPEPGLASQPDLPGTMHGVDEPQAPSVVVTAGSGEIAPGEVITIPVTAEITDIKLGVATVKIGYDPAILEVTVCTPNPDGKLDSEICNVKSDYLIFNVDSRLGVAGSVALADITFKGVGQAGDKSPLQIEVRTMVDPKGVPIDTSTNDGEICIKPCTTVTRYNERLTPTTATSTLTPTTTPEFTPTPTPTFTFTPTSTFTFTPTPKTTKTPGFTQTPTLTSSPTPTLTPNSGCPYDRSEPNNWFDQAYSIPFGVPQHDLYICPDDDEDWFQFNVSAGETFKVDLYNLPADYDLYLYDSTNNQIAISNSWGTTEETIQHTASMSGDYRARVIGYDGAWSTTEYVLKVEGNQAITPTWTPTPVRTPTPTATAGTSPAKVWLYLPYIRKYRSTIPTPTFTPSPTPTSVSAGVYILDNHSFYVDSIDYLNIVGEVQNSTPDYLTLVSITANIFNSSGQFLDTDYTYMYLDNLPPSERTCFNIIMEAPDGWSYYEFEAPTYWTDGRPLPNLPIFADSGSYDSGFGYYEIIGQVRNDHGSRVEYVQPVGTLYNDSGIVVGCDFTYVDSTDLNSGQTSPFTMLFVWRDYVDVTSYRLQVDSAGW